MPIMASCYMLDYIDVYKASNNHRDVTLDDDNEIDDKDNEITDNKITHIDDDYNLIVFGNETNHEVKIVFYDTSSSENVTATDIYVGYQLGMIDVGISSNHASQKQPNEAQIAAEEASKEIDIDALINDMNKFLLSTELHITSGILYKTDEIEGFCNDEATNGSTIDTLINDTRKSFLPEATKDDPTKDISTIIFLYNQEYSLSLTDVDYDHQSPDEIGTKWQAPDKHSPCSIGIPEHVSATTAFNMKSCYLVGDPLSHTSSHRFPNSPRVHNSALYNGECWNYNALELVKPSFDGSVSPGIKPSAIPNLVPVFTPSVYLGGVLSSFPSLESSLLGMTFDKQPLERCCFGHYCMGDNQRRNRNGRSGFCADNH